MPVRKVWSRGCLAAERSFAASAAGPWVLCGSAKAEGPEAPWQARQVGPSWQRASTCKLFLPAAGCGYAQAKRQISSGQLNQTSLVSHEPHVGAVNEVQCWQAISNLPGICSLTSFQLRPHHEQHECLPIAVAQLLPPASTLALQPCKAGLMWYKLVAG
jgi:hypothetical protein